MCFNHYSVTVAATEKVTSFWLFFRLWNTFSCTVSFFLSLLSEELLSCQVRIYCFPGKCCSRSEEYHVREMKGDICWQFPTEVWICSLQFPPWANVGCTQRWRNAVKVHLTSRKWRHSSWLLLLLLFVPSWDSPPAPGSGLMSLLQKSWFVEYFSLVLRSSTNSSSCTDLLFRISSIKKLCFVVFK